MNLREELDIVRIRQELGLSQFEMADKLNVTHRTIQNWEANGVPLAKQKKILNILNNKSEDSETVTIPREILTQIAQMTETILSQQKTIEKLSNIL